jgi:uncharacterized protein (TIGR02265 family)
VNPAEMLEAVSPSCDVKQRLAVLPPSARVRGLYFGSIESALEAAGRLAVYRGMFPERFSALGWHSAHDLMQRLVVGGALIASPERVHEGMFEIGRRNAVAFSESMLGRLMLRVLSRDPRKLLQQGVAGRRQSWSVGGTWRLELVSDRHAVMHMQEEYFYIESYLLGAAQGTFDAIGLAVQTAVELDDPYCGRHVLRW